MCNNIALRQRQMAEGGLKGTSQVGWNRLQRCLSTIAALHRLSGVSLSDWLQWTPALLKGRPEDACNTNENRSFLGSFRCPERG